MIYLFLSKIIFFLCLIKVKNLKTLFPVTNTMVNDFVIKTMETNTAMLDIKDFTYGILMGMMERLIPKD